jgi:hypothetical protein
MMIITDLSSKVHVFTNKNFFGFIDSLESVIEKLPSTYILKKPMLFFLEMQNKKLNGILSQTNSSTFTCNTNERIAQN